MMMLINVFGVVLVLVGFGALLAYYMRLYYWQGKPSFLPFFTCTILLITGGGFSLKRSSFLAHNIYLYKTLLPENGIISALAYSPYAGLITAYHTPPGIFFNERLAKLQIQTSSVIGKFNDFLFFFDNVHQTLLVYKLDLLWRSYDKIAILPTSIEISTTDIYLSGDEKQKCVLILRNWQDANFSDRRDKLSKFGYKDFFISPKGLAFKDGILYVCDDHRILLFTNERLIRDIGPFSSPRHILFWKDQLVVTSYNEVLFMSDSLDAIVFSLAGPFLYVTCSETKLYIANLQSINIYLKE